MTKHDPTTKRYCEDCNVTRNANHWRSLSHKKIKRFKRLLASNCISLTEIGVRLGFTRERARQIANQLGVKGQDRRTVCAVTRRESARRKTIEKSPYIKAIRRRGEARGWQVEATGARDVIVNGFHVHAGKLNEERGYLRLAGMIYRDCDLLCYIGQRRWVIMPPTKMPHRTTMFSERETDATRPGNPQALHHWRQFINAFHLLEPSK